MGNRPGRLAGKLAVLLLSGVLAACATRPPDSDPDAVAAYEEVNDPLEPFNRVMWDINTFLDKYILRPVTWVYRTVTPDPLEQAISNFYENARMPLTIINTLLQGDFDRAGEATQRFLVNTTLGIGGLADPATAMEIEAVDEDLGQTFAVWGIDSGPYLVLPGIGPTNPRDLAGFVGDSFGDPVRIGLDQANVNNLQLGWSIGDFIDFRNRRWDALEELYAADDPYTLARSAFRQRRAFVISNGAIEESQEEQDLFDQDFDDEISALDPVNGKAATGPAASVDADGDAPDADSGDSADADAVNSGDK